MTKRIETIGKEPYAVNEHQQFTDRAGQLVRVVRGSPIPVPVGEAYAFFDCGASKEKIEREISTIRSITQIANELELYLMEGTDSLKGNAALKQIADEVRATGIKYIIKANHPTATNRQTADELSVILKNYQSHLCLKNEPSICEIFYKKQGKYVSRDLNKEISY